MTADDFRALQHRMNMDAAQFAAFLCIGDRTVRRINAGVWPVPLWIQTYGEMLVDMATGRFGAEAKRIIEALPRGPAQ